jgi:drug/metabolite transporter (DMT)-like permease
MWLVFTLYALFASVFTVAKGALIYAAPFFLVGSRMLIAGALMLAYAAWRYPLKLQLKKPAVLRVILLGFFNIFLTNVLELWGLQYLTSFKTCFLYSLSPFLSALLSYIILGDRLTQRKWLGLAIGFLGLFPILIEQGHSELLTGSVWGLSGAEIAVFFAVACSAFGWILLQQLVRGDDCPPVVANGYSMAVGGALALIQSSFMESWSPLPILNCKVWMMSTVYLIIVSNIICYNLYGSLLKRFSPNFMAFAGLSTPLFTALFGWIFHDEVVSIWFFTSLAVVSVGLFIFYFEEMKVGALVAVPSESSSVIGPKRDTSIG